MKFILIDWWERISSENPKRKYEVKWKAAHEENDDGEDFNMQKFSYLFPLPPQLSNQKEEQ